ncbi:alpha/beta hydrolase family protein [Geminisphaera colitermitum]|uniref:alpha/beta hydrolase family protein n=1 Tax=Geminisphaera colitermitum TaxID=1148786 RepID=UPI001E532243|nr:dipeptidyl aminopeptidase [Geminisphaera colitermitum]
MSFVLDFIPVRKITCMVIGAALLFPAAFRAPLQAENARENTQRHAVLDFDPPKTPPHLIRHIVLDTPAPESTSADDPRVERIVFESRAALTGADAGQVNEVYVIIARPAHPGPHPGLLLLHGGKGHADERGAMAWARKGYLTITPDLPGIADPAKATHSRGPWTGRPYADGRWLTQPGIAASTIHQGVVAALDTFALLRAQSDVDTAHIGVIGSSWGGYMTTMICGLLGGQIRAGFSNYGCGFFEETMFNRSLLRMAAKDRQCWLDQLDAGRRASGISAPFFIAGATNDTFFYPPAIERTLAAITTPGVNRVYAPNAHHKLPVPGGVLATGGMAHMADAWFAWHLQGKGDAFPIVNIAVPATSQTSPTVATISFHVKSPRPITAATLWHSPPPAKGDVGGWPKRVWEKVSATETKPGAYIAALPANVVRQPDAAWFALVSDDRPVSVASRMMFSGKINGATETEGATVGRPTQNF